MSSVPGRAPFVSCAARRVARDQSVGGVEIAVRLSPRPSAAQICAPAQPPTPVQATEAPGTQVVEVSAGVTLPQPTSRSSARRGVGCFTVVIVRNDQSVRLRDPFVLAHGSFAPPAAP